MGSGDTAKEGHEAGQGVGRRALGYLLVLSVFEAVSEPWAGASLRTIHLCHFVFDHSSSDCDLKRFVCS